MAEKRVHFLTASEVLDGKTIADRPNVVVRHDVDFDRDFAVIPHMLKAEEEIGAKTTFYVFAEYQAPFPEKLFRHFEAKGWEIGYHACTLELQEALRHLARLRQKYRIRTTVPHAGNHDICDTALAEQVRVLTNFEFLFPCHGYVADNGGTLAEMVAIEQEGVMLWRGIDVAESTGKTWIRKKGSQQARWRAVDVLRFIQAMEPGKTYHFCFHPCWYDEDLNFIGKKS